jgi:hypothetical protein
MVRTLKRGLPAAALQESTLLQLPSFTSVYPVEYSVKELTSDNLLLRNTTQNFHVHHGLYLA